MEAVHLGAGEAERSREDTLPSDPLSSTSL